MITCTNNQIENNIPREQLLDQNYPENLFLLVIPLSNCSVYIIYVHIYIYIIIIITIIIIINIIIRVFTNFGKMAFLRDLGKSG